MTTIKTNNIVFIAANPLQILMSTAIIKQYFDEIDTTLIIHGKFKDDELVAHNLKKNSDFLKKTNIFFSPSRKKAFSQIRKIKPQTLFLDGDVGFRNFINISLIKLFNKKLTISIFEEGIGTYRNDLYKGIKKIIFPLLGIGIYMGGCKYTTSVYVTNTQSYDSKFLSHSKTIKQINQSPLDTLSNNLATWKTVFRYEPIEKTKSTECNLYLSSWFFNKNILLEFFKQKGDHYIKAHPRCTDEINVAYVTVIETAAPAELVLMDLSEKYDLVRVFHSGSSVEKYISKSNIYFIKI